MGTRILQAYGVGQPTIPVFPPPVIAQRAPSDTTDKAYPPGQLWINNSDASSVIIYQWDGVGWEIGGTDPATTTEYGTVLLTDNSEPVATKVYADNLAIAGSPVATTTTSGIGKLVSDANAVSRIASTGTQAYFVQPSNLTAVLAAPGPIGNTTAAAGTFTGLTADGTGAVSLGSVSAGDFTVGAGDLSLLATTGSIVVDGEEAVDDAIQLTSTLGGLAVSVGKSAVITTTEANLDSLALNSSGGAILTATGAAGKDITLTCTSGSINLTAGEVIATSTVLTNHGTQFVIAGGAARDFSVVNTGGSITMSATENDAGAVAISTNGGTSEKITLTSSQGTGDASVGLISTAGGVTLSGGKAAATAVNLTASDTAGGITMTAGTGGVLPTTTGPIALVSTYNNSANMYLHANGGTSETIKIHADQGTAATSLNLLSDVGGITLNAGLSNGNAITMNASGVASGFNIDAGTGGFIVDTTGNFSLDSATASNVTVTGASADLTVSAAGGSVVITGTEAAADAIQLNATTALGGIDVNAGTGGMTIDSADLLSIDAAGVVNLTTTGAFDITVNSTAGSIVITGAEAAVDAVQLNATTAGGGVDINAGSGGITLDTTAALSLDSATASNFTVTGAADLTLSSSAGAVNVTSGEANADSINVTSAGGMNVVATGAAAKDTIITNTNGSMTLTAGESVSDAMNFTASGAASGMTLTAGTAGLTFSSGQKVKVTAYAQTSGSPYTLLGTDFFLALDVTAGALTVTLPASPATGRYVIISDALGQAGANTITIDGNGKNISLAATVAGTKTITTAYKAVGLIYNGTIWSGFALA